LRIYLKRARILLSGSERALAVRLVRYQPDGAFPAEELARVIFESSRAKRLGRVAIMGDEALLEALTRLGSEGLDPNKDYQWSGVLVQRKIVKPSRRVVVGGYTEWFQWYMRTQRFRAFHTIILIEPLLAVSDKEYGGYIDGLLARLMGKVYRVVVVARGGAPLLVPVDEPRVSAVLRALLYGTRLTRSELVEEASQTLIPLTEEMLEKALGRYRWRISKGHPRLRLDDLDEELVQGMVVRVPPDYHREGQGGQIQRLFRRKKKFKRELAIPNEVLRERVLEDVRRSGWVTVPYEAGKASGWLDGLNRARDSRLEAIYRKHEYVTDEQWLALLSPSRKQIRRVLDGLVADGGLERRLWFREVGRPALAYVLPGNLPFIERRCGQCAFYLSLRRRCRLWWLVNKKRVFYDLSWKQAGSPVSGFEIHKMRYASRIGPHSSACGRFIDKKRDHFRKAIPENCEICGEPVRGGGVAVTCQHCKTKYVRFRDRVKVMTAYEHEYNRLHRAITGSDAKADLEAWKREMRVRLPLILEKRLIEEQEESLDALAEEEARESEEERPRWPEFNQALQEKVDNLTQTSDITKRLSVAMIQSALNGTRRIMAIAKLYPGDVGPAISLLEKYLSLIKNEASPTKFLTYEALAMKHYWFCYGAAMKKARQWFGPRKKSRFVMEFVGDPTGRARGYSAVDAAINYLHQRRLRQAERINAEVGIIGRCDGFLHRERYNSRRIGLLLDMIDPFKFADREILLAVILDSGLSWRDFKLETDRRGLTFYYPTGAAKAKLDQAGVDADNSIMRYQGSEMRLSEAYKQFAASLFQELNSLDAEFSRANQFRSEIPVAQ